MAPRHAQVEVWWAVVAGPGWAPLDPVERARYEAMRSPEARATFALGCALVRAVAAEHLGCAPAAVPIDRRCARCGGPHGKPRIVGAPWLKLSLSHDGRRAVCAVARDLTLGVDLEGAMAGTNTERLAAKILTAEEAAIYRRTPPARRPASLRSYWTRKEAILKATGQGLRTPMRGLTVSAPDTEPRLLAWENRPRLPDVTLRTLHGAGVGAGRREEHTAVLAVLGGTPSSVVENDATALLLGRYS